MAHPHASAFDGGDLDPVQANGIGAVRRARTEDAFLRPGGVPSWVHGQNVATRAIEPGDDDNLIAGPEAPETTAAGNAGYGGTQSATINKHLVTQEGAAEGRGRTASLLPI